MEMDSHTKFFNLWVCEHALFQKQTVITFNSECLTEETVTMLN
jgi:hypothetical protein